MARATRIVAGLRRRGYTLAALGASLMAPYAQAIENSASGGLGGTSLDLSDASVTLTRRALFVSGLTAEVTGGPLYTGAVDRTLGLYAQVALAAGDSGFDRLSVDVPTGFELSGTDTVSVDGLALTADCPTPGAGGFCATVEGNRLDLTLGTRVDRDGARLRLDVVASLPPTVGDYTFAVSAVRSSDGIAFDATAGDADGDDGNANSLTVSVADLGVDLTRSTLVASPPLVLADGRSQSIVTVTLVDAAGVPVPDVVLDIHSDRGPLDNLTPAAARTDARGVITATLTSTTAGRTLLGATLIDLGIDLPQQAAVTFTQGIVLQLGKSTPDEEAVVGDVVTYRVSIRNTSDEAVTAVSIVDRPARHFRYLDGSARLDGQAVGDPFRDAEGTLTFAIGEVAGVDDANGNGLADAGEDGYRLLTYRMIVGAGARPGLHGNTATAIDVCAECLISNPAEAEVEITLDPVFDLGTIIGKVFADDNGDGWQDVGEVGIADAMVVLDDGTYALTDSHGRYHFPAARPGQRLVKVNLARLSGPAQATTRATQVVTLTPGLLAKANFGVRMDRAALQIGRQGVAGVELVGRADAADILVSGSERGPALAVNGVPVALRTGSVQLRQRSLSNVLRLQGDSLEQPVVFELGRTGPAAVDEWRVVVSDSQGDPVTALAGLGEPPAELPWNGRDDAGRLVAAGDVYSYQLHLRFVGGGESRSERHLFGVERRETLAVRLSGGAFHSGSAELTEEAIGLLRETAMAIRELPRDKILIEGHTDSIGAAVDNQSLSERRAQSALRYLVTVEGLPPNRFHVLGRGEQRPVADNATPDGRELNRRVEITGSFDATERASIGMRRLAEARALINDVAMQSDERGRFATRLPGDDTREVRFEVSTAGERLLRGTVPLPTLDVLQPAGSFRLAYGAQTRAYAVADGFSPLAANEDAPLVSYRLEGRTEAGNTVTLAGEPVRVGDDGDFAVPLNLSAGSNVFGLVARNAAGFSRIVNLSVEVQTDDGNGPLLVVEPIPSLALQLPPEGLPLANRRLAVPGATTPGNSVYINDAPVEIAADGRFVANVELPDGASSIVAVVTDQNGYSGRIEHPVEVREQKHFLLALADGKFTQLQRRGDITSGESDGEVMFEGRLAYYFKGLVAGKYLITSAFDSGLGEGSELFDDLDDAGNRRLLSNIDPDTVYPVYGDESTLVYDAQSTGKFYLAVESDQLDALYGNYPVNLNAGELAAYQRTLYGAHATYRSASMTKSGASRTRAEAFAASVRHSAVRDVLGATGGSLYYLSRDDVIEGSEQVAVVVRDRDTGLLLSRVRQLRNEDYTIKYSRGRLLFNRPLSSVSQDASLIDQDLLSGNPVYVEVDYATRLDEFERSAYGGHVSQAIGDALTVGVTSVSDEALNETYELSGANAELRLGRSTRLSVELARSRGSGTLTNFSDDGGLSYREAVAEDGSAGDAWKIGAEVDAGELLDAAAGLRVAAYMKEVDEGFRASGNASESGTRKAGLQLSYRLGRDNQIIARHDRQRSLSDDTSMDQSTLHWAYTRGGWKLSTEIQDRRGDDPQRDSTMAAAQVRYTWTKRLSTSLERQLTIRGEPNDQTTAALEYQLSEALALQLSLSNGTLGTAGQLAARFDVDGRQYYLAQRHGGGLAGSGTATVFGAEAPLGERGTMYTEYQFGDPGAGARQSLLGLRRRWDVAERINLLLAAEHSIVDGETGPTKRLAISTAFNYASPIGLTLASRNEYRRDSGLDVTTQFVTLNDLSYRLGDDLTVLGKYRYAIAETAAQAGKDAEYDELSIGLAYRPVRHDRLNALARYTRLGDDKIAEGGSNAASGRSDVWSAEWSYQINRNLEWIGKHAWKAQRNRFDDGTTFDTHTQLAIQRINWRLPRDLWLGTEYRVLSQREADDARAGWLTEINWRGFEHLSLGLGFNFTDFTDDLIDDNDYSEHGWFLRLQGTY